MQELIIFFLYSNISGNLHINNFLIHRNNVNSMVTFPITPHFVTYIERVRMTYYNHIYKINTFFMDTYYVIR